METPISETLLREGARLMETDQWEAFHKIAHRAVNEAFARQNFEIARLAAQAGEACFFKEYEKARACWLQIIRMVPPN